MRASVPELAGGALAAELDVDFFGGQQPSSGGRTFPLVRLRRAFAELTWRHAAIFAGQESPLVQIALIDMLVQLNTRGVVPDLAQISKNMQMDEMVRQRAAWAVHKMEAER